MPGEASCHERKLLRQPACRKDNKNKNKRKSEAGPAGRTTTTATTPHKKNIRRPDPPLHTRKRPAATLAGRGQEVERKKNSNTARFPRKTTSAKQNEKKKRPNVPFWCVVCLEHERKEDAAQYCASSRKGTNKWSNTDGSQSDDGRQATRGTPRLPSLTRRGKYLSAHLQKSVGTDKHVHQLRARHRHGARSNHAGPTPD